MEHIEDLEASLGGLHKQFYTYVGNRIKQLRSFLNYLQFNRQLNPFDEDFILEERVICFEFFHLLRTKEFLLYQKVRQIGLKIIIQIQNIFLAL